MPAACRPSDLLTVNIDQIPLLKDALAPGIHIQPLRLDPEKGQVVLMATMAPGCRLPVHYHTGTAEVYTFSGCWKYAEYPNQPQTAGSYLYEPGGSAHTFYCPCHAGVSFHVPSITPITELASPTISRADDDCGDGMYYNYETLAANPGYRWTWSSIRGFRCQFRIVVRFRSQSPRPDCWTPSTPSTPTSQTRA